MRSSPELAELPYWFTLTPGLLLAPGQDTVQSWGQAEPTGGVGEAFLPALDSQGKRGQEMGRSSPACIHRGLSASMEWVLPWEDAVSESKL